MRMSVAMLDSLKALGKQISWVRALNGQYKSAKLKREYDRSIDHYSGHQQTNADLWAGLAVRVRANAPLFAQGGHARLFFLGTDELQDKSGIIQALDPKGPDQDLRVPGYFPASVPSDLCR
jgi:hypothetical protein